MRCITPKDNEELLKQYKIHRPIYLTLGFNIYVKFGEYTNTKGTRAFAIPNLNAVLPVVNGFDPAIPAAAYAARATGGVMSAKTP